MLSAKTCGLRPFLYKVLICKKKTNDYNNSNPYSEILIIFYRVAHCMQHTYYDGAELHTQFRLSIATWLKFLHMKASQRASFRNNEVFKIFVLSCSCNKFTSNLECDSHQWQVCTYSCIPVEYSNNRPSQLQRILAQVDLFSPKWITCFRQTA